MMASSRDNCCTILTGYLSDYFFNQILKTVTGVTKTKNRHESILAEVGPSDRFQVKTGEECQAAKFQNVVFCAPPSGFEDYPGAVEECITKTWAGPSEGGTFVFTSSGGM